MKQKKKNPAKMKEKILKLMMAGHNDFEEQGKKGICFMIFCLII